MNDEGECDVNDEGEAIHVGLAMFPAAAALGALAATAPAAPGGDPATALVIAGVSLSTPLILRPYGAVAAGAGPGQSIIVEVRRDSRGTVRLTTLMTGGSSVVHVSGSMFRPAAANATAFRLSTNTANVTTTTTTTVDIVVDAEEEKEMASEQRRAVLASAALTVFSFARVSSEAPMRAAAARLQAPCREPGWVDPEVSDAALHLVAAIAADATDLRTDTGSGGGGAPAARVPAAIAACCFQHPSAARAGAGLDTVKGPSWPTATARLLPGQANSRSKVSDHVLVGGGGEGGDSTLITVNALLVKTMGGGAGTAALPGAGRLGGSSNTAAERAVRRPAAFLRHEVSWKVAPGDAKRRDLNNDGDIKDTTSFVPLPRFLGAVGTAISAPARRHTSSSVASDLAAALAASQGAVLASILSKGLRVGTIGSSGGGGRGAAESMQPRDERAAGAAVRGAALHAVARTLAQEIPGLDGAAVDSDPADAAVFGSSRGGDSGGRFIDDDNTTTAVGAVGAPRRVGVSVVGVVAIADTARHRYGAAIRGSTEALPTLLPGVSRTTTAADASAAAPADVIAPMGGYVVRVTAIVLGARDAIAFKLGPAAASSSKLTGASSQAFIGTVIGTGPDVLRSELGGGGGDIAVGDVVVGIHAGSTAPVVAVEAGWLASVPTATVVTNPAQAVAHLAAAVSAGLAVHAAAAALRSSSSEDCFAVVDGAGSAAGTALVHKLVSMDCPVVAATTEDVGGFWGHELRRVGAHCVKSQLSDAADGGGDGRGGVIAPLVFTTRGVTPEAVAAVSPGGTLVVLSPSFSPSSPSFSYSSTSSSPAPSDRAPSSIQSLPTTAAAITGRSDICFVFASPVSAAPRSIVTALIADAASDIVMHGEDPFSIASSPLPLLSTPHTAFAATDVRLALLRLTSAATSVPVVVVAPDDDASFSPSALITGGTGALGAQVGLWLASRGGANRVVLTGRSGRADWSKSLRALGWVLGSQCNVNPRRYIQ